MQRLYDSRKGTLFGMKMSSVLLFGILAFVAINFVRILAIPLGPFESGSNFLSGLFGKSENEEKQETQRLEHEQKAVEKAKSVGSPLPSDVSKANQLYEAMSSNFGNDAEVIQIFSRISGKSEMNRIFSAFGIKTIRYGLFWLQSREGNLDSHITWSNIDRNKQHQRAHDKTWFTIQAMLNHVNG